MQPAITITAEHDPAIDGQLVDVSFGADSGQYVYSTDAQTAHEALAWVLEAAAPTPLNDRPSVGIDIETTSLEPRDGRIRLAQVAAGDRCVVLDCFAFDVWAALRAATEGREVAWIAHNAEFEQSWISHHEGFTLTPMFDTRWVFVRERTRRIGDLGERRSNLAHVCQELLGFELSKEQRLSDWSASPLSWAQIEYGALDALVLIPLRLKMERDALEFGWEEEVHEAARRSLAEAGRFS
jgi:ribonuclease D